MVHSWEESPKISKTKGDPSATTNQQQETTNRSSTISNNIKIFKHFTAKHQQQNQNRRQGGEKEHQK